MLGTLLKAGELLELFDSDHPEWGVTEIADELGISKSSAHNLLSTLSHIGLLLRTTESRYRLGWQVLTLSQVALWTSEFRDEAKPAMRDLVARFGEPVFLTVLGGIHAIHVETLQGTQPVQVSVAAVGVKRPAYCSAGGKVLLAHRPWIEVEAGLRYRGGLRAFTPHTITSLEELKHELASVREQDYACNLEEAFLDLCCVAAPIRDHTGSVIAAMSLSAPSYRFDRLRDDYRIAIQKATLRVSRNLGYVPRRKEKRSESPAGMLKVVG